MWDEINLTNTVLQEIQKAIGEKTGITASRGQQIGLMLTDLVDFDRTAPFLNWLSQSKIPTLIYLSGSVEKRWGLRPFLPLLENSGNTLYTSTNLPPLELFNKLQALIFPSFTLKNLAEISLGIGCPYHQELLERFLLIRQGSKENPPLCGESFYLERAHSLPPALSEIYQNYQKTLTQRGFSFGNLEFIKKQVENQLFLKSKPVDPLPIYSKRTVLTQSDLEGLVSRYSHPITLPTNALLTDLAKEWAQNKRIEIIWIDP